MQQQQRLLREPSSSQEERPSCCCRRFCPVGRRHPATIRRRYKKFGTCLLLFLMVAHDACVMVDTFTIVPTDRQQRAAAVPSSLIRTSSLLSSFGGSNSNRRKPDSRLFLTQQQQVKSASRPSLLPPVSPSKKSAAAAAAASSSSTAPAVGLKTTNSDNRNHNNFDWIMAGQRQHRQATYEMMMMDMGKRNMTTTEMMASAAGGTLLTVGIVFSLAMSNSADNLGGRMLGPAESLETASLNIVDAVVPMTASDVVSVAFGEAIAGLIGAAISFNISFLTMQMQKWQRAKQTSENSIGSDRRFPWNLPFFAQSTDNNPQKQQPTTASPQGFFKVSDAVADGDFLLTNAAAYPLFEAVGLPPSLAGFASTFLAIVPYGIVKVGARRREQLQKEDALLEQLLLEEEERRRKGGMSAIFPTAAETNNDKSSKNKAVGAEVVDPNALLPVQEDKPQLDVVEAFSDTTKWLQFSVLQADFRGQSPFLEQVVGLESAIFGSVAALSSQLYADVLYDKFGLGGANKQEMVRSRSAADWGSLYLSKLIYHFVLFGVYEAAQTPAQYIVAAVLSGGADGCYGSNDFSACVETYIATNPPGASPEAQLRSFITAAVSLWNNLSSGIPLQ